MRHRRLIGSILLVSIALLLSGCFYASELGQVRRDIERDLPQARFDKQVEFTIGPMSLGMVRLASLLVPQAREVRDLLKEIDRVKVAIYETEQLPPLDDLSPPRHIQQLLERRNWEMAVRIREENEMVWVLYSLAGLDVRDLYVVVLDADQLVLVHVEGRLEQLISRMVENRHLLDPDEFKKAWKGPIFRKRDVRNATLPDFWEVEQELLDLRYNRVDGLYAGWRLPRARRHSSYLDSYGELGYALGGRKWNYQIGGELRPPSFGRLTLGGELHHLTATQDAWIIPEEENSLTALFARRDFRDYYRRTGWSLYAGRHLGHILQFTGSLVRDDFASLDMSANWSLFDGGRKHFRPNPSVDELEIVSLQADLQLDTRDKPSHPGRGWLAGLRFEKAGDFLGGDADFHQILLDLRRYQPIGQRTRLDLRLRLGKASSGLPVQYLFDLGGHSTLRGYGFKEFTGDRLLLLNAEYWLDAEPLELLDGLNLGFFFDAGSAWFAGEESMPVVHQTALGELKLKTNAGIAADIEDFRFYFARPFDAAGDGWNLSFRLSRTF